ncbi:MAG: hypothetical protein Q7S92_01375 [Candidatus Diapherotrites archaeon]|nr:hypothetical protein [Candidatus Diapherotrites archaeon]
MPNVFSAETTGTTYAIRSLATQSSGAEITSTNYNLIVNAGNSFDGNLNGTSYAIQLGFITSGLYSNPQVAFVSPTNNATQTSATVTLDYNVTNLSSTADLNGFVKKFWISVDSAEPTSYVDNGLALRYTFSSQSNATHRYRVKVMNLNDQNTSTATVDVNVNVAVTSNTVTTGVTNSGGDPPNPNDPDTGKTVLLNDGSDSPSLTSEDIRSVLADNFSSEDLKGISSSAVSSASLFKVNRKVQLRVHNSKYYNNLTLTIENLTDKPQTNIWLFETIPKEIAETASLVSNSSHEFDIVKDDPAVAFIIPILNPGEKQEILYQIDTEKNFSNEVTTWQQQPAFAFLVPVEKVNLCANVVCEQKTCQLSRCNLVTGQCAYSPAAEGSVCGENKVCSSNACVDVPVSTDTPTGQVGAAVANNSSIGSTEPQPPSVLLIGLAVLAGIIALLLIFVLPKLNKPKTGLGKFK